MRSQVLRFVGVVFAFGVGVCGARAETYGFGGLLKRSVVVERRLVPEVQLANASINVVFPSGSNGLDVPRFRSQLESDIARGGQNIFLQEHDPQFEIRLTVTGFERPHVERTTDKGGTHSTAVGKATVVMQLVHHADGQVVFAGTESYAVSGTAATVGGLPNLKQIWNSSARQPTTDDAVALELTNGLAAKVASHLVTMSESVPMMLAKGPGLDGADKLAEAKRWNEYLESLSTMAPAADAADDAYRLYDIGVANEALGYASDDPKVTLKYLREASVEYSKAIEDKGSEKYFVACQERIEKALERYTTLDQRNRQTAHMEAQDTKQNDVHMAQKRAGALDNSDVIKLVQGHVDAKIILMKIRTAPAVNFDTGTDGLIDLSRAGVPSDLILEMSQRMQSSASAAVPTRTPAAAPRR